MAIVRDATGNGNTVGTSLTFAHTCTGSSGLGLFVAVLNSGNVTPTSVTYNGVAMAFVVRRTASFSQGMSIWFLASPATGTHNVVVTFAGSQSILAFSASYTGVSSTQPDSSNSGADGVGQAPWQISTTVVASNCWLMGFIYASGSGINSALVSGHQLGSSSNFLGTPDAEVFGDSNGTVSTGSQSFGIVNDGTRGEIVLISIAPGFNNYSQPLSESFSLSDTLIRSAVRSLSDSFSISDVLAAGKFYLKTLAESLAITDALSRGTSRILAETASIADTLIKTAGKILSESISVADTIAKSTIRVLTEVISLKDTVRKFINGLLAIYSNKFSNRGTGYGDKYSGRSTPYDDKYHHLQ